MRRSGLVLGLLLASSVFFASAKRADAPQSFPLSPGTYWVYRGLVRSHVDGSVTGKVAEVTWKMSVVRAVERDGLIVVVVKGFPGDLNWTDGNVEPQLSILIETPDGKFYLVSTADNLSILSLIDDEKYPLQELLPESDQFLRLPLAAGQRFGCDEGAEQRQDGEYCWVVGGPHPATLVGIKGVSPGNRVSYQLDFVTNPDDIEFEFVPGIGITSYGYHHHGTIAETDLHLTEFHSAD